VAARPFQHQGGNVEVEVGNHQGDFQSAALLI
jgi:hypothetical protein